jgi:transcriptional regulator with XRE-family HTH domain
LAKNRVSQLRKSRGLTQRALAELAGTSQQQVQRIEAGLQGVRLELATRIAKALGGEIAEIFPSLSTGLKLRGLETSRYVSNQRAKLLEAGLDPDPNYWTVNFFAFDGRVFSYVIPSDEKDRLEKIVSRSKRSSDGMFVFTTSTQWVALNRTKIAATQFLFDRGLVIEDDEGENLELKLHLIGAGQPVVFGVEPDTHLLDDDEEGSCSQLQRLFLELEMASENEIVEFYDEDRERVYIESAEVLAIEAPLVCCEPALLNAQREGHTEDDETEKLSARSAGADK